MYSAQIGSLPILTIYGEAALDTTSSGVRNLAVGIGTTSPMHMLDILAGSTTPDTTGKTTNYYGVSVNNQATSSTASITISIIKRFLIHIYLTFSRENKSGPAPSRRGPPTFDLL